MRLADFRANDWAAGWGWRSTMSGERNGQAVYEGGVYSTPHGYVFIHRDEHGTMMTFGYRGREYSRSWPTRWSDRGVARAVTNFVLEIAGPPVRFAVSKEGPKE